MFHMHLRSKYIFLLYCWQRYWSQYLSYQALHLKFDSKFTCATWVPVDPILLFRLGPRGNAINSQMESGEWPDLRMPANSWSNWDQLGSFALRQWTKPNTLQQSFHCLRSIVTITTAFCEPQSCKKSGQTKSWNQCNLYVLDTITQMYKYNIIPCSLASRWSQMQFL